jgi:aminopeptidase N
LTVTDVRGPDGSLPYAWTDGRLDVVLPTGEALREVSVDYAFAANEDGGLLPMGATLTWPYYCGNVFPCRSNPAEGLLFSLDVTGVEEGLAAVYPPSIPAPAPAYQLAWVVGDYGYTNLGTTPAGTEVGVWWLEGGEANALAGTAYQLAVFEWLEETLGSYTFGSSVASVSVPWGPAAYGGMEHHPYWHVASGAMSDPVTHAHEAAHGWYGDGVRIACWEDFVLSEGLATYLAARALAAVGGAELEAKVWAYYEDNLDYVVTYDDGIAWPDSCGEVDILEDGLFSGNPYYKGAFFLRAVEAEVGQPALDAVLGDFYLAEQGQAAGMQDLLDMIHTRTGYDPTALAEAWLQSLGAPPIE